MKCFKYNSDLDPASTINCFYESTLQLSMDNNELIIMNKHYIPSKRFGIIDNNSPVD